MLLIQQNTDKKRIYNKRFKTKWEEDIYLIRYYPIINKSNKLRFDNPEWRNIYYKYYFYNNNLKNSKNNIELICKKYIEGLQWNIKYYLDKCVSWKWYYPFRAAPSLRELCQYLNNRIYECEFDEELPFKPVEQLFMVLPLSSKNLLPKEYKQLLEKYTPGIVEFFPSEFNLDIVNKFWFHECDPILPILDEKKIINILSKIKLNELDLDKNSIYNKNIVI